MLMQCRILLNGFYPRMPREPDTAINPNMTVSVNGCHRVILYINNQTLHASFEYTHFS